jgi:hypothetical protein
LRVTFDRSMETGASSLTHTRFSSYSSPSGDTSTACSSMVGSRETSLDSSDDTSEVSTEEDSASESESESEVSERAAAPAPGTTAVTPADTKSMVAVGSRGGAGLE